MGIEPGAALFAPALGEGVLFVLVATGEEPSGGIAERLAGVGREVRREFPFPPFAGPAESALRVGGQFRLQDLLPGVAAGVAEADPGEMEEFVGEDAGVFGWIVAEAGMEMNFAAADIGAADGGERTVAEAIVPNQPDGFTVRWR